MFFIQEIEVQNFADDTTIYSCSPNFEEFSATFLRSSKIDNNKIIFMTENKRVKFSSELKLPRITKTISSLSLHILKIYAAQQAIVCVL